MVGSSVMQQYNNEVNNFDGCKILLGALDILLPLTMLTYFRCGEHFVLPVYIFPGSYTGGNICNEQEICICMQSRGDVSFTPKAKSIWN